MSPGLQAAAVPVDPLARCLLVYVRSPCKDAGRRRGRAVPCRASRALRDLTSSCLSLNGKGSEHAAQMNVGVGVVTVPLPPRPSRETLPAT